MAGFFGAGVPSEVLAEHIKKGFEAAPASVWDPAARVKDQELDGVRAEVIYTSRRRLVGCRRKTGEDRARHGRARI